MKKLLLLIYIATIGAASAAKDIEPPPLYARDCTIHATFDSPFNEKTERRYLHALQSLGFTLIPYDPQKGLEADFKLDLFYEKSSITQVKRNRVHLMLQDIRSRDIGLIKAVVDEAHAAIGILWWRKRQVARHMITDIPRCIKVP